MVKAPLALGAAVLALSLLSIASAQGSIVIHDSSPGIVAMYGDFFLDSDGHTWVCNTGGWERTPSMDPPLPVEQIKFWESDRLVTMDDVVWIATGDATYVWTCVGPWPDGPVNVQESTWGQIKARFGSDERNSKKEE